MTIIVRVDPSDHAPCNVRCLGADHYCAGYPHCVAGHFHAVKDWLTPGAVDRKVIREETNRSAQGGYIKSRVIQGPDAGSSVEEVELHCRTLQFESLVRPVPDPAAPRPPDAEAPRH
jgi:hypothetical protein